MEVDQKKTGGDMKVECKLRSGGDMPTPLNSQVQLYEFLDKNQETKKSNQNKTLKNLENSFFFFIRSK